MNRTNKLTKLAIVGLGAVALLLADDGVHAADHAEAPGAGADPAADIADFYAWRTENDTLVAAVTFLLLRPTTINFGWLREPIDRQLTAVLGRDVSIDGIHCTRDRTNAGADDVVNFKVAIIDRLKHAEMGEASTTAASQSNA